MIDRVADGVVPELLLDAHAELGEGATWDPATGRLLWVDILGRVVHRYDPETGRDERWTAPREPGSVVPSADGRMVVGMPDGVHLLDPVTGLFEPWAAVPHDPDAFLLNDGYADPAGRFWVGSMARDVTPGASALYRVDTDGSVTTQVRGVTCSNGIGWSPDGATLYYIDTTAQRIDAYAYDVTTGDIADRRTLVEIPQATGLPDGMTVDVDGCLWVAIWDGGVLHRYRPDGTLDAVVTVGTPRVTSCAFGGPALDELYVTSATVGVDPDIAARTHAGGLWRLRPGVRGLPSAAVRSG